MFTKLSHFPTKARKCRAKLLVAGGFGMIHIKGLVFGEDFFKL